MYGGHQGNPEAPFGRYSSVARVEMYTTRWCGYCVRAKALLDARGIPYEEIYLDDGEPIGGYTELWRLDREGRLDERLAA